MSTGELVALETSSDQGSEPSRQFLVFEDLKDNQRAAIAHGSKPDDFKYGTILKASSTIFRPDSVSPWNVIAPDQIDSGYYELSASLNNSEGTMFPVVTKTTVEEAASRGIRLPVIENDVQLCLFSADNQGQVI